MIKLPGEAPNALVALCQQLYDHKSTGSSVAQDVWQDCLEELRISATAQPKCQKCGDTGMADSGGTQPWGEPILIDCDCATAQPVSDVWVKCSDRMPEEMSDVLVTDGKDVKDMWWNGKKWDSWAACYSLDSDSITHWMQKPAAPGGQDD